MNTPCMNYAAGDRVRDVNTSRDASERGTGTVVRVEWEDEFSPTVYVQWDNNTSGVDAHGVLDIEPLT